MLTGRRIDKYDREKICTVYDKWPQLAEEAYKSDLDVLDLREIDHIIFVGMGGSGILGNFFASIISREPIHVDVVKGYHLPKSIGKNSLLVATSVSGNTLETLTVLEKSKKNLCHKICFSSGGKLEKYCDNHNVLFKKIPMHNSPRASFPSFAYSILNVLQDIMPLNKNNVQESLLTLKKLQKNIRSTNLNEKNHSLRIAKWLDKLTAIYYPFGLEPAAIRFKNCLQENAKVHATAEDVLEACHNGIVSWDYPSNVKSVMIKGKDDYVKTKRLWKILKQYFEYKEIDFLEINSIRGSILTKLMHLIYLLDYSSIYKAILLGRDPSPVEAIDYIKSRMY